MTIIKRGLYKRPIIIECRCQCVFTTTKSDLIRVDRYSDKDYKIDCPECENTIYLDDWYIEYDKQSELARLHNVK